MFTAARLRLASITTRCQECGSYRIVIGICQHCDWVDPSYEPPQMRELSDGERADRGGSR
jgi:hypothetical protein